MSNSDLPLTGACDTQCPVARAASVIEGKWTTTILRELLGGTRRYSELQRALSGISPKILADRLAMLQAEGMVAKTIHATVPPKTEYALTDLGREAEFVIRAMAGFGAALQARDATRA